VAIANKYAIINAILQDGREAAKFVLELPSIMFAMQKAL
jgi:hypothetical protein